MIYALFVRQIASGLDLDKLNGILAGEVQLTTTGDPNSSFAPGTEPSIEELRETWGSSPEAIASKAALDAMMGRVEKGGKITGTGSG